MNTAVLDLREVAAGAGNRRQRAIAITEDDAAVDRWHFNRMGCGPVETDPLACQSSAL